jgi:hypothetical protein
MHEFNQSLKYDKRMYAADVKGSIAFSKALLKAGILVESEQKEIERGLKVVESEWKEGKVCSIIAAFSLDRTQSRGQYGAELTGSSLSKPTMRTSTLPTRGVSQRLSERISGASCTQVEVGTTRLRPICVSGS